ncbi:hypothetical protein [Catellatospora methionotrophica]|uniref:hypothetical protein n=1 Tax=Catellatospora methionotrophica TaxID=121620 RepID=UPI003406A6A4
MSATLLTDLPPLAAAETTLADASRAEMAPLDRALSQAPLGAFPLLEAAFGWQELRPSGWHRPAAATAIAQTSSPAAAARLASLLSTLTWANVVRTEREGLRVEVSAGAYNRITRALTGAWRSRTQLLSAPESRQAALGVWRMAMLTGGVDAHAGQLTVRASSPAAAQTLVAAAARLNMPAIADRPREGGHPVRLTGRAQVYQLLTEATGQR